MNLHNFMHNCTGESEWQGEGQAESKAKGAMDKYLHMSHAQKPKGGVDFWRSLSDVHQKRQFFSCRGIDVWLINKVNHLNEFRQWYGKLACKIMEIN